MRVVKNCNELPQSVHGVSIIGGSQNTFGHTPEQPAVSDPA